MSSLLNPVKFKHESHYLMAMYLPQETNGPNVKGGVRLLQEHDSQVWYQALQALPKIEIQSILSKGMGKEKERNSGLNPSGNPSGSQLNRPSEIIRIPPLTSNTASLLPVAPDAASLPPVAPDVASLPPVTPDVAPLLPVAPDVASLPLPQGDDGGYADNTPLGHHDSELSSNAMDYLQDFNNANLLSDLFQVHSHHLTANSDTASLLHDPFLAHHSTTNALSLLPEQPLQPGEVTCGGIAQPLPVSAWRIASTGADRPQVPSSLQSGPNVIRGHARHPPYRHPPVEVSGDG
ncbi:hypothetical protein EDB85DRAFT_1893712 [Lactarius pseudohatsudake]|nr:hypothetical protein EDB85DRAFT_1893712 [Lactarius pseudohatsudake]